MRSCGSIIVNGAVIVGIDRMVVQGCEGEGDPIPGCSKVCEEHGLH